MSNSRGDNVEIIGTKGKISFSTFGNSAISYYDEDNKLHQFNIDNPKHIEMPLINTIINELQGKGFCPSTGESGSRTSWVIDQVLKDYRMKNDLQYKNE
ncbi:hypothetical protein [Photorhabdus bodei]|uniref:hypothetical protein n=1 Tax=Photorhabdus bodei TaxID=2029681 RepID=UPI00192ECC5A|nr:hypothetical protein [Photorhabdus bodei]